MAFYRQDYGPSNAPLSTIPGGCMVLPGAVSSAASIRMATPVSPCGPYDRTPAPLSAAAAPTSRDDYSEELWQACAGPLVYVPQKGDRVIYFPQGHMEQVTALTHPDSRQKLPHAGLDSQILCRVVDRTLSAEPETDEVFAHVTLLPTSHECLDSSDDKSQDSLPPPPPSSVRLFTKILTVSDTSTHGGFSVLRKHAEECLPPLNMSQDPPTQDLVARDLHCKDWPFKHTYRGHPRRHLLTTGWSVFVSHKRLMAGDVVIFLRGENGHLRVGIRRAKRQPTFQQAVMSNISMHMGVVATAKHAVATRTIFSVFYKPRVSLSSFLVLVEKFKKSMSVTHIVGMRFKMRFETEDASDRSYPGTITGIDDLEASSFPNSKWRSLKVDWDEMISNDRPERVSPWEIDLTVTSPSINPTPPVRTKRVRPSPLITSTGTDCSAFDCGFPSRLPRVLQGQEPRNAGISSLWRSSPHGLSSMQETYFPQRHASISRQIGSSPTTGQSLPLPSPRASYYSSYVSGSEADYKFPRSSSNVHGTTNQLGLLQGSTWSVPPANEGVHNLLMLLRSPHSLPSSPHSLTSTQLQQEKSLVTGNVPVPPAGQPQLLDHSQHRLMLPYSNLSSTSLWETHKYEAQTPSTPTVAESGCKLFGISLTDVPLSAKAKKSHNPVGSLDFEEAVKGDIPYAEQATQGGGDADLVQHIKSDASSEQERIDQNVKDPRTGHSTRSRVKVIKKGTIVGRGVDLLRFDDYESLLKELEVMFNMEGELTDPSKGWLVAYHDGEGDTMKVGDDPWPEFCNMVKKLYILSPEEVGQGSNHANLLKEDALQCQVG